MAGAGATAAAFGGERACPARHRRDPLSLRMPRADPSASAFGGRSRSTFPSRNRQVLPTPLRLTRPNSPLAPSPLTPRLAPEFSRRLQRVTRNTPTQPFRMREPASVQH
eukprot:1172145-Prorocentrum_minimum.AAC.1